MTPAEMATRSVPCRADVTLGLFGGGTSLRLACLGPMAPVAATHLVRGASTGWCDSSGPLRACPPGLRVPARRQIAENAAAYQPLGMALDGRVSAVSPDL